MKRVLTTQTNGRPDAFRYFKRLSQKIKLFLVHRGGNMVTPLPKQK